MKVSQVSQKAKYIQDNSWTPGEEGRAGLRLSEVRELTILG